MAKKLMIIEVLSVLENMNEAKKEYSRLLKRRLRNSENPFEMDENEFIKLYRFPQSLVLNLIDEVKEHLYESRYNNGIPVHLKLLSALRFYASGSYQRGIGQETFVSLSQTCMSNNIYEVSLALNKLLGKYIVFPKTIEERSRIKQK